MFWLISQFLSDDLGRIMVHGDMRLMRSKISNRLPAIITKEEDSIVLYFGLMIF